MSSTPTPGGFTVSPARPSTQCWTRPEPIGWRCPPKLFLRERIKALRNKSLWNDAIVSHLSAANYIYQLANRQPETCDYTSTARRIRAHEVQFFTRANKPQWELIDGLPVTTIPQTIADLYADDLDQGHLGEIVYDAMLRRGESLQQHRHCSTWSPTGVVVKPRSVSWRSPTRPPKS